MWDGFSTRLQQQMLVRAVGIYIAVGFVAIELAWFLSCRPFYGYWALPVPMGMKTRLVCVLHEA